MFCFLWVLFQALAVVVHGGVSASAEAQEKGVGNNNGRAATGKNANPAAQNGVPLNEEPLVARLIQIGASFFLQPVGTQLGQAPLQQLIPVATALQGGPFPVGQTGGLNTNPQGQVTSGGPVSLLALLRQGNAGGAPGAGLTPDPVQLIPVLGFNNQQQPSMAVGNAANRGRFQRSVATRLRVTNSPGMKAMAAAQEEEEEEEEDEEEEECSGMGVEQNQAN